jgi:hypothetical protein
MRQELEFALELSMSLLIAIHTASTLFMTGLIWFVQGVHYPLMAQVGPEGFPDYAARHAARTALVVGPAMLAELGTAIALLTMAPASGPLPLYIAGLILLAVIWITTGLVQVPQHDRLQRGFEGQVHRALVNCNWIRTVAWSLRSGVVLWLMIR